MEILFQDSIVNSINSFTLETLPHTILIKGDVGSGRHLLCNYLTDKFKLELIDITEQLNLDTINNIYVGSIPRFYFIDGDKISVKEQNVILKLFEEPCAYCYLLMINSSNILLPTIDNRCYKIKLKMYTRDELRTFLTDSSNERILDVSTTPGQVISYQSVDFNGMELYAKKIFDNIATANFSNCLVIPNNIKLSETDEGYDIDLFGKILLYVSKNYISDVYLITNEFVKNLKIPHINKKLLFDKYLLDLKYRVRWKN